MHPGDDFTKFRVNNLCTDTRAARRSHRDGEVAVIADEQRRPKEVRAHFGLAELIGPQRGYMGSRTDHTGMQERLVGPGRGHDNIGITERGPELIHRLDLDTKTGTVLGRKLPCPVSGNVVDPRPRDWTNQQ